MDAIEHAPPVFALANHKGGCAKTTSTANLGAAWAAEGLRVLLVDADPQGNLGEVFGIEPEHPGPRLEDVLATPAHAQPGRPDPTATAPPSPCPPESTCCPCTEQLATAATATDPPATRRRSRCTRCPGQETETFWRVRGGASVGRSGAV
jgi:cellulose biosynthesis protein BcsQ